MPKVHNTSKKAISKTPIFKQKKVPTTSPHYQFPLLDPTIRSHYQTPLLVPTTVLVPLRQFRSLPGRRHLYTGGEVTQEQVGNGSSGGSSEVFLQLYSFKWILHCFVLCGVCLGVHLKPGVHVYTLQCTPRMQHGIYVQSVFSGISRVKVYSLYCKGSAGYMRKICKLRVQHGTSIQCVLSGSSRQLVYRYVVVFFFRVQHYTSLQSLHDTGELSVPP